MYTSIRNYLLDWNKKYDNRAKLQHAYVTLAAASLVVAGLMSLVNYELGQKIVSIALVAIVVFFVNFFAWILFENLVISRLDRARRALRQTTLRKKR